MIKLVERALEGSLWIVGAFGATRTVLAVREQGSPLKVAAPSVPAAPSYIRGVDSTALADAAAEITDGNLFRPDRQPSDSSAAIEQGTGAQLPRPPSPPVQRPRL